MYTNLINFYCSGSVKSLSKFDIDMVCNAVSDCVNPCKFTEPLQGVAVHYSVSVPILSQVYNHSNLLDGFLRDAIFVM